MDLLRYRSSEQIHLQSVCSARSMKKQAKWLLRSKKRSFWQIPTSHSGPDKSIRHDRIEWRELGHGHPINERDDREWDGLGIRYQVPGGKVCPFRLVLLSKKTAHPLRKQQVSIPVCIACPWPKKSLCSRSGQVKSPSTTSSSDSAMSQ